MNTVVRIAIVIVSCSGPFVISPFPTTQPPAPQDPKAAPVQSPAPASKAPLAFGLAEDTPVRIRLARTMSSKDAKVDERVDFEVLEDVKVGNVIVIERGAMAIATVTEAHPKRRMGRAGKLKMNIDYVRLASGDKAPLTRGERRQRRKPCRRS